MKKEISLSGRLFISFNIHIVTGLHIGSKDAGMEIGGIDNPIIRDSFTGYPYIPGSSLRGKMRSQIEKKEGSKQNAEIGQNVYIHVCGADEKDYSGDLCDVCRVFGTPAKSYSKIGLLIVRDCFLNAEHPNNKRLQKAHTDLDFTELKTEATIDRVTSAATPRTIERVPAGAVFGPAELVFSIYESEDFKRFHYIIDGLQLIQDDYLGGYGSRGSGKVCFEQIGISCRNSQTYTAEKVYEKIFSSLTELEKEYDTILTWAKANIPINNKE